MPGFGIAPIDVMRYQWGRRMFDPKAPSILNPDGSSSTHRMSAEVDSKGNWWAFPTIVQLPNGNLYQFKNNFDALRYNIDRGEAVHFGADRERALAFAAGGYKIGSPLEPKIENKSGY